MCFKQYDQFLQYISTGTLGLRTYNHIGGYRIEWILLLGMEIEWMGQVSHQIILQENEHLGQGGQMSDVRSRWNVRWFAEVLNKRRMLTKGLFFSVCFLCCEYIMAHIL